MQSKEKNREHLPLIGVGPLYCLGIVILTAIAILLSENGFFSSGKISQMRSIMYVIGVVLLVVALYIWISAVVVSKINEQIKKNSLVTNGIYAWVRNPVYAAFMIACTAALVLANNLWLLLLVPIYWLALSILMKCTEEKWLAKTYGETYKSYCKNTNRCIPWFPKK